MAAIQSLPPTFVPSLKQKMFSEEDILCFLEELDPTWAYQHSPESILNALNALTPPLHRSLELVLSYGNWSEALCLWLVKTFPIMAGDSSWPEQSLHVAILRRVVEYVHFHVPPHAVASTPDRRTLAKDFSYVNFGPQAIQAAFKLNFDETPTAYWPSTRKKMSQADRKKLARKGPIDTDETVAPSSVFTNLGVLKPQGPEEVRPLVQSVALELKRILEKYLSVLQDDTVSRSIRESFVLTTSLKQHAGSDGSKPRLEKLTTDLNLPKNADPVSAVCFSQPLKASLYFDSVAGFGQWEIIISSRCVRDLRTAFKKNKTLFNIVMKKMKELSNAHFSNDNQKQLNSGQNCVAVYEAKMTGDTRLVYQIDCISEYQSETNVQSRQVIRVFGVYTHTEVNRLWESLGVQLSRKGKEYLRRCSERRYNEVSGLYVPAVFPPTQEDEGDDTLGTFPELPKDDLEEIHSMLVLEKFITFSQELRNSILAGLDVAHVFNMSPQEMEIVEHPYSCYVYGRSGTGKTTTMMFKMLGLERAFAMHFNNPEEGKPRQLFVTQSRMLASKVEDYFVKLLSSLEVGGKTELELQEMARQQAMLSPVDEHAYDDDDNVLWKSILPKKFSELRDEHFPLFVTFEKLAEMIIADLLEKSSSDIVDSLRGGSVIELSKKIANIERLKSDLCKLIDSKSLIDYDQFASQYWPRFPQNLIKGQDSALTFSQIMGVIQGSEKSLSFDKRYIDASAYVESDSQSEVIYEIFLKYLRRKRENYAYDAADRTHTILQAFELFGVPGRKVDFLYVDEAQDNMLIDAKVLRSICRNPIGLFWAGDTAQTIAVGNTFRFEELKSFMFRVEEQREKETSMDLNAIPEPTTFFLTKNYRSHGGIVACAHSIIEMITAYWPQSIDRLPPEKGIVTGAGLRPFFFGGSNESAIQFDEFLKGGSHGEVEFGAGQCILVRNQKAKDQIYEKYGDIGSIFTVYDSKGLEFDDVLLYQFFEDSKVDQSRWRLLVNFIPGQAAPAFDVVRHAGLCSELKTLYVAITRARKKLWIYDNSQKSHPLRDLWTHQDLVEDFTTDSIAEISRFAISSTPQEWKSAAWKFFKNKNYEQAIRAFKRAKMHRHANIAGAYQLRKLAQVETNSQRRRSGFLAAAASFLERSKETSDSEEIRVFHHIAGECFETVEAFVDAAKAFLIAKEYLSAGRCYERAEAFVKAAKAYLAGEEFDLALRMYKKEGMFDEGVEIIKRASAKMDANLVDEFKDIAKTFYFRDKNVKKAKDLFESTDDALAYLEENSFLDESRALLLVEEARRVDAAEVHLSEGRTLAAIEVLLEDETDLDALAKAPEVILQSLWQAMPFGRLSQHEKHDIAQRLEHASKLKETSQDLDEAIKAQIDMFLAIHQGEWGQLRRLGKELFELKETASAILCFSHYFHPMNFPSIRSMDNSTLAGVLSDLLHFCRVIQALVSNLKSEVLDQRIQRLFNFHPSAVDNTYTVPAGAWLREQPELACPVRSDLVASQSLLRALEAGLLRYITTIIEEENRRCHGARAFTPCLQVVVWGFCPDFPCRYQHMNPKSLTPAWFTVQVRIHFLQVLICQIRESIPMWLGGGLGNRRYWVARLWHTLKPSTYLLGSPYNLDFSTVPEAEKSGNIVKTWCREILRGRSGLRQDLELTGLYQAADLCFHLDRPHVRSYIHQSRLVKELRVVIPVLPDMMGCLDGFHPNFIIAGVRVIRDILNKKLFIDLNVLCNFAEYIGGALIVAHNGFRWHNITLPRGLCQVLLRRIRRDLKGCYMTGVIRDFLDVLCRVLTILVAGTSAEYFLYGHASAEPWSVRKLFISRICRAMCLVGYNIHDTNLQKYILEKLSPLKAITDPPHRTYQRYLTAQTPQDIAYAVWHSTDDSSLDGLVHLWSKIGYPPRNPPPSTVKRIFFQSPDDIFHLLRNQPLPAIDPQRVQIQQPLPQTSVVAHDPPPAQNAVAHGAPHPVPQSYEHEVEQNATQIPLDLSTGSEEAYDDGSRTTDNPEGQISFGEKHLEAARELMNAYLRLLKRRQRIEAMSAMEVDCNTFFEGLLKHSETMQWPEGSTYKKHYLGTVPHLLVCLQWARKVVSRRAEAVNQAFKRADPKNMDKATKDVRDVASSMKKIDRIRKLLQADSSFHAQMSVKKLFKVVDEVEEAVVSVSVNGHVNEEIEYDLRMAKRVEVQPDVNVDGAAEDLEEDWMDDTTYR